jgi:hypothetical protein
LSKEYFEERYVSWDAEPTPTAAAVQALLTDVKKRFAARGVP